MYTAAQEQGTRWKSLWTADLFSEHCVGVASVLEEDENADGPSSCKHNSWELHRSGDERQASRKCAGLHPNICMLSLCCVKFPVYI